MLLRHWSLQESIHNSNYVIAQLSLTRDPGQQRYTELLARIGIPLMEAKQKYSFMNPAIRRDLKRRILDKSQPFGLDRIITRCHLRQVSESL